MATIIEVKYFNTYIIKKIGQQTQTTAGVAFPGGLGILGKLYTAKEFEPVDPTDYPVALNNGPWNWFVEESRIRGGFNNTSTDYGARAYLDEENPLQQKRISTLIYSGIYNSRTGINQTNVFSVADSITKSLDPDFGSIQKTFAEETNLIVFQEDRIHRALIDKDTIYTTESGTQTQAGKAVIGQFVQYKGEYGISKNPESFAIYNYRKYFSDKNRNAIMRLSNDGLTEISSYGMRDWFRDNLALIDSEYSKNYILPNDNVSTLAVEVDDLNPGGGINDNYVKIKKTSLDANNIISVGMQIYIEDGNLSENIPGFITYINYNPANYIEIFYSERFKRELNECSVLNISYETKGMVKGGWDIYNKAYTISLQKAPSQVNSGLDYLSRDYDTLVFDEEINGWVSFFTYKPSQMFSLVNKFYTIGKNTTSSNSSSLYLQYDGSTPNNRGDFYNKSNSSSVTFVFNPQPDVMKNFNTISYEGSNGWEMTDFISGSTGFDSESSLQPQGQGYVSNIDKSNTVKSYEEGSYKDEVSGYTLKAGFDRKENRYVANLVNRSQEYIGEVVYGSQISGIKGYFATVTFETDETTQAGGPKELWSSASNYVISSY